MKYEPEARFFTTIGNYRQAGNVMGRGEYNGEIYYWRHSTTSGRNLWTAAAQSNSFGCFAMVVEDPADRQRLQRKGGKLS